jgi:hypothetical protein
MSFEQIGQKLKSAREGQNLTLTQIWERTKIPMHHLQSMEAGGSDDLPETVYVAGFIKRYADIVGLNGQALSDEYRKEAVTEPSGNGNGHFARPRQNKGGAQQAVVVPAPYMGKTRIESGAPNLLKMMVFPALSVLMLITLIALLLKWHSDTNTNQVDPSMLNLATKYNQVPATAPTVGPPTQTPTIGTAPAAATPDAPMNTSFVVTASKHVWLDVHAISSGESLFTGNLEAGDRRDFKDAQGIRIRAGDGGKVTVESDGKSENVGAQGKISERTFATKGATGAALAPTGTTADGKTGSTLTGGANGALTTAKPPVKKPVKRPDAAAHHRRLDEAPSRQYMPGENMGGRSIDVPYRYTEGRLDTDQ